MPVRLHRQAAQGQLRREDDRRRDRRCCRQALFTDDVARSRVCCSGSTRARSSSSLIGLLVAAALVRHIPVLVAAYAVTLALARRLARCRSAFFVKRVWLFIPIFTGIIVLPATFSFVTPGDVVVPLGTGSGTTSGSRSRA